MQRHDRSDPQLELDFAVDFQAKRGRLRASGLEHRRQVPSGADVCFRVTGPMAAVLAVLRTLRLGLAPTHAEAMVSRGKGTRADTDQPELRRPVDEARAQLVERVRLGHELEAVLPTVVTPMRFDEVRGDFYNWHEYNEDLIRSLFQHPDRLVSEYRGVTGFMGPGPRDALHARVTGLREDLNAYIRRLSSLAERLDLFQGHPVPSASTEHARAQTTASESSSDTAREVHIHIERGSTIGNILLDSAVDKIENNINASRGVTGEQLADALKAVTEACTAGELEASQQQEALEIVEYLSTLAASPADARPAVLRATLTSLGTIMGLAASAGQAWTQWAPIIEQAFHLGPH